VTAKKKKSQDDVRHELRRGHLDHVLWKLTESGEPLRFEELGMVRMVLEWVRDGRDPRKWFGIEGRPGPRDTPKHFPVWVVVLYLKFRQIEPGKPAKAHRGIVADDAGLSDSRLREIIAKHRAAGQAVLADPTMAADTETVEAIKSIMISYKAIESACR
jgi:hypothetical protein